MPRRFVATIALFSALACGVQAARGQTSEPIAPLASESGKPTPAIGVPDDSREPDLDAAVAAFLAARSWLDAGTLPDVTDRESAYELPGARGVAVLLRHQGRLIGVGTDWPGGGAGDDRMLRRAVGRAVARALGDRLIATLPPELRDTATKELSLELECAARPDPLLGRTFAECVTRLEPGLDGIAIRRGGGSKSTWAATFPAVQHASNTSAAPERSFFALLTELELPLKDLPDLIRTDPVGVFKFSSLRLAQTTPQEPPLIRGRGAPRFVDSDVTAERVRQFAVNTLARLEASKANEVTDPDAGTNNAPEAADKSDFEGILGNYAPVPDEYKPLVAPPLEQALTAWAAAALSASERFGADDRAKARAFAIRILNDLAVRMPGEESATATIPPMAFILCAVSRLGGDVEVSDLARDLARVCREKLLEPLRTGSPNDRPLAALAASMALSGENRVASAADTRKALDAAWSAAPRLELAAQLPWLVLGEAAYARNTGEPIAHAKDAMAIAELLLAVQAGFGAFASELDVRGGFRLTGASRGGVTSQSLRPGLGIAAMLSHPGLVPEADRPHLQDRARALLRFALELSLDERESRFFQNPGRARGGVRTALWDSIQPVAANAMAALVAVEGLDGAFSEGTVAAPETHPESPTKSPR